jgi:putative DNA primase/helicase
MPRLSYPGERPAMNLTAASSALKLVVTELVPNGADHSARPAPLEPNIGAIKNHLHVLFHEFANRYQDALIEIAFSNPSADHKVDRGQLFSAFDPESAAEFAALKNKEGCNVYVGVALRRGDCPRTSRAGGGQVLAALYVWGEYDRAGDDERIGSILKKHKLQAAIIVTTGTEPHPRRHLYLKLSGDIILDELRAANTALRDLIGGDNVQDVGRIMRLAGTINYPKSDKRGLGYIEELVTLHINKNAPSYGVDELIGLTAKTSGSKTSGSKSKGSSGSTEGFDGLSLGLRKTIASPPDANEDRSVTAASVISQLMHRKWSREAIQDIIEQHPNGIGQRYVDRKDALAQDIARIFAKFEDDVERDINEAEPASNLPVIKVKAGKLSSLATRAEALLISAKVAVYQRSGTLVRPIIETVDASHGRKSKIATLKALDTVYLRDLLGRHAIWVKQTKEAEAEDGGEPKKTYTPIDPPTAIASTVLARVGDWMLPTIAGVISTPTMRPDGSLLIEQGYDEATRLLLVEPPAMPAIPDKPTREDALAALKLIEDLLIGFPFVDGIAKSVALSGFITPVVRGAFPVTPLHAGRAPTAGSGKSYLWDIVAANAIGQLMPVMSTGASTEETEKRLGSALMKSQPLIAIDNISGELGGDALCQAIERPVVDIRVLGKSENVRIEARGTSLFATGNNFTIVGDVCRRVITCNLDAEMEQPEFRQFDFDPVDRVLADRGKYIAAALTICRAYIVARRPNTVPKLASFEGWSDTVRSALVWLGQEDPVKSMEAAKEEDPERQEIMAMQEAWALAIGIGNGSRVKLSAVLMKGAATVNKSDGSGVEPTHPELHAALEEVCFRSAGKRGQPDARMLGKWLQRFKGKIVDNKRFMRLPSTKHGSEWWLEITNKG